MTSRTERKLVDSVFVDDANCTNAATNIRGVTVNVVRAPVAFTMAVVPARLIRFSEMLGSMPS